MSADSRSLPHIVIRASAGTGKTFQLSNRFLKLLAADEPLDSILATTFTRKAAGEILARVLLRLAEAAADLDKLRALADQLHELLFDRPRCLAILAGLVRRLHRRRVGTLDSFFLQIARSFSLELGLPPGWQIVDEVADEWLRAEAVRAVLRDEATGDVVRLMHLLTKGEASRSVSQQIGALVKALYSEYLEAPPEAWEGLRGPKPLSAEEFQKALDALRACDCGEDGRVAKARNAGVESLERQDWEGFLLNGLGAKIVDGSKTYYDKPIPDALAAACEKLVCHCRAMIVQQIAHQTVATRRLLDRFDAAYQRLKAAHRALRFEDVTRKLAAAWVADRLDAVVFRLDGHVAHLLLDEFQDTAPLQWRVVRPFARRVVDGAARRSFFCVGDVKQAIYGWRGGLAEIFDALEAELPGLRAESLNTSRRSSPAVIDTVNRAFAGLPANPAAAKHRDAAEQWGQRFAEHSTARKDLPGYCRLVAAPKAAEADEQNLVTWRFAAELVAKLRSEAPGFTIGVLVRRNEAVARLIYELRQLHVEASEEGGNPLTDSAAVELVLSLLALADHPGDTAARFHVATSPLGPAVGLTRHDDDQAACRLSREIRRRLVDEGYGPTIYGWARALAPHCDARDVGRLVQLVEMAYGYESRATLRVDDFARVVRQRRVEDPRPADVRVMTVHQAKGLEFDVVVLPELEVKLTGQPPQIVVGRSGPAGDVDRVLRYVRKGLRPLLPPRFQEMFQDHERRVVEESLCLLYVSMTRAIHALHLVVAPSPENEQSLRSTFAGVLRAALTDGAPLAPGAVAYEHGDPAWFRKAKPRRPAAAPGERQSAPPATVRLAAMPERSVRGLDRRSPSEMEGGGLVDLRFRLRLDAAAALDRGTLVHAWFEQIEWLDGGPPDDAALVAVAERLFRGKLDVAAHLADFRAALCRPAIRAALTRATYEQIAEGQAATPVHAGEHVRQPRWGVHRELPFAVRESDVLVSGQMDRLVVLYDGDRAVGADLLDFKTDTLPAGDAAALADRVEVYRPQLNAYRRAAARRLGLSADRVSARLVFVVPGAVVEVSSDSRDPATCAAGRRA